MFTVCWDIFILMEPIIKKGVICFALRKGLPLDFKDSLYLEDGALTCDSGAFVCYGSVVDYISGSFTRGHSEDVWKVILIEVVRERQRRNDFREGIFAHVSCTIVV